MHERSSEHNDEWVGPILVDEMWSWVTIFTTPTQQNSDEDGPVKDEQGNANWTVEKWHMHVDIILLSLVRCRSSATTMFIMSNAVLCIHFRSVLVEKEKK